MGYDYDDCRSSFRMTLYVAGACLAATGSVSAYSWYKTYNKEEEDEKGNYAYYRLRLILISAHIFVYGISLIFIGSSIPSESSLDNPDSLYFSTGISLIVILILIIMFIPPIYMDKLDIPIDDDFAVFRFSLTIITTLGMIVTFIAAIKYRHSNNSRTIMNKRLTSKDFYQVPRRPNTIDKELYKDTEFIDDFMDTDKIEYSEQDTLMV